MNRSRRSTAGLLALLALSLFVVEAVGAAMCPPDDAAREMVMSGASDEAGPTSDDEGAGSGEPTRCPLGVAAVGGCVAPAVLSAVSADLYLPQAGTGTPLFVEVRPDFLLSRSLFRPPRA